jgi:hypothetical protein
MTVLRTSPAAVTRLHEALWQERGARSGACYAVTPCPYSAAELAAFAAGGRQVAFLPPELATQSGRHRLGMVFPAMASYALLGDNPVSNDLSPSGWFDYESVGPVPYAGLAEDALLRRLAADGRTLLSLNQYIVATQDHHHFSGRYLDETTTWARVSSRFDGRLVAAVVEGRAQPPGFVETPVEGSLRVAHDLLPGDRERRLGARSTSRASEVGHVAEPAGHQAVPPVAAALRLYPPASGLEQAWHRLAKRYVDLGFPGELSMSEGDYRRSLPRFGPQPAEYEGRFDVPLLIDPRVPWQRQCDLAGIRVSRHSQTAGYRPWDLTTAAPALPYAGWFNRWGKRFAEPTAPGTARTRLASDEVGGSILELIAMELACPALSRNARYFEAIGLVTSPVATDSETNERTPMLNRTRRDEAQIACNLHPVAYSTFRPLVRGHRIFS